MNFDLSAVYGKTGKGAMAVTSKSKALPSVQMRILALVDGKSSVDEILESNKKFSGPELNSALEKLASDGYIKLLKSGQNTLFVLGSKGPSTILVAEADVEEFFAAQKNMEALSATAEADAESQRVNEQKDRELESIRARNQDGKHLQEIVEKAASATAFRDKIDAEHQARKVAAAQAKAEADEKAFFRAKAEARMEAKRKEDDEAQAREIADAIARKEAARKAREETEAREIAEADARRDAERLAREAADAIAKAEAEERALLRAKEKARVEAEVRAQIEADRKIREEAAAQARAEAEKQARLEAEEKARAEAEAEERRRIEAEEKARIKAEEEARKEAERKAREEAEAIARAEAEERRRIEAEEKARAKAEEEARKEAERKAREEAEAIARAEAEERRRIEAEEKARIKAEEKARKEAERKAREEAEALAKAQAEERKRLEAEEKARIKAEEKARKEAERKAREEAEALAEAEAAERKRRAAEEKAKAEAEARAKAEEEARLKMEAVRKAREEAEVNKSVEAREREQREAEQRAMAEAAARNKEIAEEKARKEAENEERERLAIEARARFLAETRAQENDASAQIKVKIRKPRKPFKFGRAAQISLALLVLVPLILLHVVSLNIFAPAIAKLATDRIHEPVMINSVRASLWPTPHLRLEGVSIGNLQDVKISTVRVMPALMHLFGETKILKAIEIEGGTIDQDALPRVAGWLGSGGNSEKIKLSLIQLRNTKLEARGIQLPPLNMDIALAADSTFKHARISSADNTLNIDVTPKGETFDIKIAAKNWQPPLALKPSFDELNAKATATREGMTISDFEGQLYGGSIKGTATVTWGTRWNAAGGFTVSHVDMNSATPALSENIALSGRLDANATYAMEANTLATLFDTPRIKASFSGLDGAIGNVDLSSATMGRKPEDVKGGQTKFSKFSGNMVLAGNRYQLRQLKLESDTLKANGELDIQPNKELTGRASVEMRLKSSIYRSRLSLAGSLKQPSMRR